jgi:hypothetical protein
MNAASAIETNGLGMAVVSMLKTSDASEDYSQTSYAAQVRRSTPLESMI